MLTDPPKQQYRALALDDDELLKELFSLLSNSVSPLANPYGEDGSYAPAISRLPIGLRAMAATHHLDISLTLDDIGWHFLNFGEPGFVRETKAGLRELGLNELSEWFSEAYAIVNSLRSDLEACDDFRECLIKHGQAERIDELTRKATLPSNRSLIYESWVRYAREHPENVFSTQESNS